jgi:hypothetical protein
MVSNTESCQSSAYLTVQGQNGRPDDQSFRDSAVFVQPFYFSAIWILRRSGVPTEASAKAIVMFELIGSHQAA